VFTKSGFLSEEYYNINVNVGQTTVLESVLQIDQGHAGTGNISGTIKNALTGSGVDGLSLKLRKGINVTSGTVVSTTTTSGGGTYAFYTLNAGNYTTEASGSGYLTTYFSVLCLGGQTISNQDATIAPILPAGETRIVLTWGETPYDLDSHLTGPLPSGTRFHMYYPYKGTNSPWPDTVNLDLDDTFSYGPETTTLYLQMTGIYRFSVHDYSNRNSSNSYSLSNSGAQVRVYKNSGLVATFNVPSNTEGTLWRVFEMSGNTITPLNELLYVSSPDDVNKLLRTNIPEIELFKNLPIK
jgi:uncharacterized protein YfaP (DUF2135 family)